MSKLRTKADDAALVAELLALPPRKRMAALRAYAERMSITDVYGLVARLGDYWLATLPRSKEPTA